MSEQLASVEELADWLPFTMTEEEEREANAALISLSDDARHYGKPYWTTPERTPAQVKHLVLRAAARHMKNYEGYTMSRAGDETVQWTDRGLESGTAHFTEREITILRELAGNKGGIYSVGTYAHSNGNGRPRTVGNVRDAGSNEPIPYFAGEGPW